MPTEAWQPSADIDTLIQRASLLATVRKFFADRDIVEVQTSILSDFGVTDVNIENLEVNIGGLLQSSPEYQMKRLLAAGMPSCYQICPSFREGEVGRWHAAEFVMLEWYRIGYSLESLMQEVSDLIDTLMGSVPTTTITIQQLLESAFEFDVHVGCRDEISAAAKKQGLVGKAETEEQLDFLIGSAIEQLPDRRVFVTDYPKSMAALAKIVTKASRKVANRFELVIDGLEIANGYDELLDPAEFRCRAEKDNASRRLRGLRPRDIDSFLEAAMTSGLPDCCGVAVGLERLFALALGKQSLDEVQAFPFKL